MPAVSIVSRLRSRALRASLNRSAARPALQALWLACLVIASTGVANMGAAAPDLADLSLEQLGNVVVTTVSRRPQAVGSAPASIYVVTRDDIRRAGVTSLPEALRLAPNLHVGRADVNQYGITARGSNSVLANKMLVMVDGRTVYSPIFSGVFWETVDVLLEDVERIEVISGPGATLWGINAVNGVINVITRSARDTRGVYAEAGGGTQERGGAVRYGTDLGDGALRVYAKGMERDHGRTTQGVPLRDASDRGQLGFRYDSARPRGSFTLQGDAFFARVDQAPSARDNYGANLLVRWSAPLNDTSELTLQGYADHFYRHQPGVFRQRLDTFDGIAQFGWRPHAAHRVLLGAGYRTALDRSETPSPALAFIPGDRTLSWGHAFAQDEFALSDDLSLTFGAKVETNVYTGAEFLPNLRLAWQPQPHRLLWGALSRAVRAPARIDRDFYQPAQPPHFILAGGPEFVSETAHVVELGYREQSSDALFWSATLFHNDFDRLRSVEPRIDGPRLENLLRGRVYGIEAWAEWRVAPWWRVAAGGVRQRVDFEREAGSQDVASLASLSFDPSGWWKLRSSFNLPRDVELDATVRRVGGLHAVNAPPYMALDVRLGWRPTAPLEVSVTVKNASDAGHVEWGPAAGPAEHPRTVFVRAVWRE